jgi:hypothetical protein
LSEADSGIRQIVGWVRKNQQGEKTLVTKISRNGKEGEDFATETLSKATNEKAATDEHG